MGVGGYNTMTHTTKHTPGPWVAALGERLNTDVYHIDKQGNRVFVAEFATQTDAVLSAAAPAMYEALETVPLPKHNEAIGEFYTRFYAWYEGQRKQALAQAEGRQA